MLTVEACLRRLEDICCVPVNAPTGDDLAITNTWDRRFITDVALHVSNGSAISTSQSTIVLKLIDRYKTLLEAKGVQGPAIDQLLIAPLYEKQPYQSVDLPREVRWAGDNKLVFRCKYNQGVVEDIKRLKGNNSFAGGQYPVFVRDHKLWIVDVTGSNYERVMDIIKRHKFAFDDDVAQFFLDIENNKGKRSEIVTDGEAIAVTVYNDDLLNAWLNTLQALSR